jgi:hypothetical protein
MPGELDGRFGGLGAGVGEKHPLLGGAGRQPGEPLAQGCHALVVEIGSANVEKTVGGVLHRGDDFGMSIAG